MAEGRDLELKKRVGQVRMLGEALCSAMEEELLKMGFKQYEGMIRGFEAAEFELSRDPFDGKESVKGTWRNSQGYTQGMMLFYPDGTFYAEHDVIQPHPTDSKWFVEAVTAWGRGTQVKTEPRLLPALAVS